MSYECIPSKCSTAALAQIGSSQDSVASPLGFPESLSVYMLMAGWPSLRLILAHKKRVGLVYIPYQFCLRPKFGFEIYSYSDWANMFEELSHLLQVCLLSQACDVDCAVLRVILLFRASCNMYTKNVNTLCIACVIEFKFPV